MSSIKKRLENIDKEVILSKINEILGDKESKIHLNQLECGIEALKVFDSDYPRNNHIIIEGKTQSGKTGVLTGIIMLIKLLGMFNVILVSDEKEIKSRGLDTPTIYYITGDNSVELKEQTIRRVANCFQDFDVKFTALKNSDMKKDLETGIKRSMTNCIIFIDESHYGTKDENNILIKWLDMNSLDLHNSSDLDKRNVYIISNSATPWGEEESDLSCSKTVVKLKTNDWSDIAPHLGVYRSGYVGVEQFLENGCLRGVQEQLNKRNIEDFCRRVISHLDELECIYGEKKCAIIRLRKDKLKECEKIIEKYFHIETFYSENNKINYDRILTIMQNKCNNYDKPILFIIDGAFRMGITIPEYCKKNIGVVFDYSDSSIETTVQGLLGRVSGYASEDYWKDFVIYVNKRHKDQLENYIIEDKKTPFREEETFVPDENGDEVGIVKYDYIFEYSVDETMIGDNDKEYNEKVREILEDADSKYKDMVFLHGRRNSKENKTILKNPHFSDKEWQSSSQLRKPENLNKYCYTTLYLQDDGLIKVRLGKIVKGRFVKKTNFKPIATMTT